MNGDEITRLITQYKISGFKGVWTIKAIPELAPGDFVVYNLSENEPGTHWAYMFCREIVDGKTHYEVFDSLGASETDINKLIQENRYILYNSNRFQPLHSDKCGLFACYFAIILSENEDLDYFDIINVAFVSNVEENDQKVISFFLHHCEY